MSFYRSDPVGYYKLILPRQSAWEIMDRLGTQKLIHIVPSQLSILNRPFITQVRRCQDALQRMLTLENLLKQKTIHQPRQQFPPQAYSQIFQLWKKQQSKSHSHPTNILNDVINQVDHAWNYQQDLMKRADLLTTKLQHYRDNLAIILAGQAAYGRSFFTNRDQRAQQLSRSALGGARMSFQCGVINIQDEMRLKKTAFRITKGNCLISCTPFNKVFNNVLPQQQTRIVFFILYPGGSYLDRKIGKLVQNFTDIKYQLPSSQSQFSPLNKRLQTGFLQSENLLALTQKQLVDFLQKLAQPLPQSQRFHKHQSLKLYLLKQKQLYSGLNQMEFFNNFLQGKIYVRKQDIPKLQESLVQLQGQLRLPSGQLVPAIANKYPTHFTVNDFTRSAQQIVQTYGVARYQEANPSLFTCVTFPFLFGVMFGDIGHGLVLFGFGLILVFSQSAKTNPILKILYPHRYLLTMMGFFATYCGFIYNDYLSMSLNLFKSCYMVKGVKAEQIIPRRGNCVYPFGLDPVWSVSSNYLNYVNSLKMKISVIIAVVHMTFGVLIKSTNTLYYGKCIDFIFEFIPQLAFMVLLFGYMDFLIIYKWTIDYSADTSMAPSIITTMINLPLKLGKTTNCCGGQAMFNQALQDKIQYWFLIGAVIAIPMMLLPKPLIQIYCNNDEHANNNYKQIQEEKEQQYTGRLLNSNENLQKQSKIILNAVIHHQKQENHSSNEIFVHQLIETIQYVLGCISNTASYLRLWALSLAHSQLSQVFFNKIVEHSIVMGFKGIPGMLIGFVILAGITFGVLLCMDSMECFLHTLRLHWVQFNSKFYKADGFSFKFYSFSDKMATQLLGGG